MISEWVKDARTHAGEVEQLVGGLSQAQLDWRPGPNRWSVGEHIIHLAVTNQPYFEALGAAIERARDRDLRGEPPYRSTLIGNWFARGMEPPVTRRIKTFRQLVPPTAPKREEILRSFRDSMARAEKLLQSAQGLDLGRARMRSPFMKLISMNLAEGFQVIFAHNRRHFWLAREVMQQPGFPAS